MPISNWYGGKLLDSTFIGAAWPSVSAFVALHTSDPTVNGNTATEMLGRSYARKLPTYSAATNRATVNSTAVTFSDLPAGTITHIAVWSAATNGNMLFYGALTTPVTVAEAGSYTVKANDLALVLN